jgi:hypothetical protein
LTHVHLLFTGFCGIIAGLGIAHVSYRFYDPYHNLGESATAPLTCRRHMMWVIEINFAGRKFTHNVFDRRRPLYRLATRTAGWRPAQLRGGQAA